MNFIATHLWNFCNRHKVVISNTAARISAIIVFFVSLRVVLPQHGASLYGAWATLAACLGVLSFLDFGFGNALIAKLGSKKIFSATKREAHLVKNSLFAILVLSIMFTFLLYIATKIFDLQRIFSTTNSEDIVTINNILPISLVCLFLQVNANGITKVYFALDRPHIAYFTYALSCSVAILILLLFPEQNINFLFFIAFGMAHAAVCVLVIYLHKEGFLNAPLTLLRFYIFVRHTLRLSAAFTVIQLGAVIMVAGDYLIISSYVGTAQAGEFAFVQKNVQVFSMAVSILSVPMLLRYARMSSAEFVDPRVFQVLMKALFNACVISALGVLFLLCATKSMADFVSNGQLKVYFPLIIAMSVWMSVENAGIAFTAFKNGTLMLRQMIIEIFGNAVLAFVLKIYFINYFGIITIPLVSSFVYLVMTFVVYFVLYKRETLLSLGRVRVH